MTNRDHFAKGFTLIELLVVISIISLLVAILLPSLTKARELAKLTICASQMRQWGVIHHTYAGESEGELRVTDRIYVVTARSPEVVNLRDFHDFFSDEYAVAEGLYECPLKPEVKRIISDDLFRMCYTYLGQYTTMQGQDISVWFHGGYQSPCNLAETETWWVLMTDQCRSWESQTNHWFEDRIGTSVLCVDGHAESQSDSDDSLDDDFQEYFDAGDGYWVLWQKNN